MSGETEEHVSGWTVDTTHVHVLDLIDAADKRNNERFIAIRDELHTTSNAAKEAVTAALIAQKEAVAAALMAAEKAVLVAEANSQLWRASANEWRGSMDDRERNFARGDFVNTRFEAIMDKVTDLSSRVDRAVPTHELAARVDRSEGRGQGTDRTVSLVMAILVVLVSALGIAVSLVVALTR